MWGLIPGMIMGCLSYYINVRYSAFITSNAKSAGGAGIVGLVLAKFFGMFVAFALLAWAGSDVLIYAACSMAATMITLTIVFGVKAARIMGGKGNV